MNMDSTQQDTNEREMPKTVGRYQIEKPIGKGGQGKVYSAYDPHLKIRVAIKQMSIKEDSINELALLKAVNHPSLVKVYDFIIEEKYAYLVMELIEGMTLKDYLAIEGCMNEKDCILITLQLCEAIRAMHEAKPCIVYRDLKPENIMITPDKKLRLIDLGGGMSKDYSGRSEPGIFANRAYSAPEVFSGASVDEKADIYSIGMIMHEMLTASMTGSDAPVLRRPVREFNPALSEDIEEIILLCCCSNPSDRFHSVTELEERLRDCRVGKHSGKGVFLIKKILVGAVYVAVFLLILVPLLKGENFSIRDFGKGCVLIGSSMLFHLWLIYLPPSRRVPLRVEKEVWLTGKKYLGLFGIFLVFGGALGIGSVNAVSENIEPYRPATLLVEMKDSKNRNILLKEGAALDIKDGLHFDIPEDSFPEGADEIHIIARTKDGHEYVSREIKVCQNQE